MKSEQINELAAALSKAQSQIEGALKESNNPFHKSKYADLHEVWRCCREPLTNNGLSVTQTMDCEGDNNYLVTTLMHSSGQWIDGKMLLPLMKIVNKETKELVRYEKLSSQELGGAITYARRYCLAAILGISQMDDDGESTVVREQAKKHVEQPAKEVLMDKIGVASESRINKYIEHIVMKSGKSPHDLIRYALSTPEKTGEFKKGLAEFEKGQMIVQSGSLGS